MGFLAVSEVGIVCGITRNDNLAGRIYFGVVVEIS